MNPISRLNTVAPDLAELGARLSGEDRLDVARRVALWACRVSNATSFLGEDRLSRLFDRSNIDEERRRLEQDVSALDEKYFALQDEDRADEAVRWFSKARAVSAMAYSLTSESQDDFCEALYEAYAATDDLIGLRRFIA